MNILIINFSHCYIKLIRLQISISIKTSNFRCSEPTELCQKLSMHAKASEIGEIFLTGAFQH